METNVVLTWDSTSKINLISNDIKNLRVVGWDKITGKWVDLGSENVVGNINEGSIKSSKFIPNDYDVLTIGSDLRNVLGVITSKNYGISPNGDGINDTFVIEGLELYPNNTLKILNRWGAVVYSTTNYKNDWDGISEHELTIGKKTRLPAGTYFYILYLNGKKSSRTGYIYLNR
nr:gliding motility-associated C-terminal domain-containing protein [Lutibacter sp. B1]